MYNERSENYLAAVLRIHVDITLRLSNRGGESCTLMGISKDGDYARVTVSEELRCMKDSLT